ncbi:MAG: hypothetical protein ACTSU8_01755 [Alphaproteobacteria bacterium]
MFNKRILISTIAVFVTFSVYGWLVWGVLLSEALYAEMGGIWRAEGEEQMAWIFIAYALMAYVMAWIWKYGNEDKGVGEGVRYGLMLGALFGSAELIAYAVQPITMKGALMAFGIDVVMFVIAGIVLSVVYKKVGD